MVVRIRLQRLGVANNPYYAIAVAYGKRARDGKFIERVGSYDPVPHRIISFFISFIILFYFILFYFLLHEFFFLLSFEFWKKKEEK